MDDHAITKCTMATDLYNARPSRKKIDSWRSGLQEVILCAVVANKIDVLDEAIAVSREYQSVFYHDDEPTSSKKSFRLFDFLLGQTKIKVQI